MTLRLTTVGVINTNMNCHPSIMFLYLYLYKSISCIYFHES